MDIRGWPLDRIMQLPDCCFGRRFSVSAEALSSDAGVAWDIAEIPFPEQFVLWEVVITTDSIGVALFIASVRLALGDQLPTTSAMMNALEPLVPGLGIQGAEPRYLAGFAQELTFHLRNPIRAMGRRLVLEVISIAGKTVRAQVICEVSSVPKEVPD